MSVWTYISGAVKLSCSALSDSEENVTFSYPDEQMFLGELDASDRFEVYETSLPILKEKVSKAVDNHLPIGEFEHIDYNLYQSKEMYSYSGSDFFHDAEFDQFNKLMINAGYTKEDDKDFKPAWVYYLCSATLTILDEVRYCDSSEMMNSLFDFFAELMKNNVTLGHGSFTWRDNYELNYIFSMEISRNKVRGIVSNPKDHSIVAEKTIELLEIDEDREEIVINESDKWKKLF